MAMSQALSVVLKRSRQEMMNWMERKRGRRRERQNLGSKTQVSEMRSLKNCRDGTNKVSRGSVGS